MIKCGHCVNDDPRLLHKEKDKRGTYYTCDVCGKITRVEKEKK